MGLLDPYRTGLVAVTESSVTVVGTGVIWSNVVEGDWFVVGSGTGTQLGIVDTVNGTYDEITLKDGWEGATDASTSYRIYRMSVLRYSSAQLSEKVRQFIVDIEAAGLFLFVEGAEPDQSFGEDGQYALKTNTAAPWKLWYKIAGTWVLQGNPAGFAWRSAWSSGTAYAINDVVSRLGKTYVSILAGAGHAPESSPTYWDIFNDNGDVYDVGGFSPDRPSSGENILSWLMNRTVTFPAGLTSSMAKAGTAATLSAVFSVQKNSVEFGIITIAPGGTSGSFASASGAVFAAGDVLDVIGPSPRDATLADMHVTLYGSR